MAQTKRPRSDWDRQWDKTKQAQEYRKQYAKEHYMAIRVQIPKQQGKAYKDACRAAGIPYSRPLQDIISDVISGKHKPL